MRAIDGELIDGRDRRPVGPYSGRMYFVETGKDDAVIHLESRGLATDISEVPWKHPLIQQI